MRRVMAEEVFPQDPDQMLKWQCYFLKNITKCLHQKGIRVRFQPWKLWIECEMVSENAIRKNSANACWIAGRRRGRQTAGRCSEEENVLNSSHLWEKPLKLWCCLRSQKVFDFKFNRRLLSQTTARNLPACDNLLNKNYLYCHQIQVNYTETPPVFQRDWSPVISACTFKTEKPAQCCDTCDRVGVGAVVEESQLSNHVFWLDREKLQPVFCHLQPPFCSQTNSQWGNTART